MADDDETGVTRYCALALLCVVVTASCWLGGSSPDVAGLCLPETGTPVDRTTLLACWSVVPRDTKLERRSMRRSYRRIIAKGG